MSCWQVRVDKNSHDRLGATAKDLAASSLNDGSLTHVEAARRYGYQPRLVMRWFKTGKIQGRMCGKVLLLSPETVKALANPSLIVGKFWKNARKR